MEVRVADAKTTTALEQDGSLRCLLKIKYKHRDRHSVPAVAWAKKKADEVSRRLLKGAGLESEADGVTICVNLVELGEYHHSSWISWDLYLESCTSEARDRIDQSTREPIYMISKRGDVLIARKAPKMDLIVAGKYERSQELDPPCGAKPYNFKEGYVLPDDSDDDGKEIEEDDGLDNWEASAEESRTGGVSGEGENPGAPKASTED